MTSQVTINGRSITGWRKYVILVPIVIGSVAVCALTYLAIIPLLVFLFLFLLPVVLLAAVLGRGKKHND